MTQPLSRRELLHSGAALGALVLTGTACGKTQPPPLSCTDTSSLSSADITLRAALGYLDQSTEAGRQCRACQQFVAPPSEGQCGTCKIVKGPINPGGYCKSFVAKPA
jgi:hypothetical protein